MLFGVDYLYQQTGLYHHNKDLKNEKDEGFPEFESEDHPSQQLINPLLQTKPEDSHEYSEF